MEWKNPSLTTTVCHRSASLVTPIGDTRNGFFDTILTLYCYLITVSLLYCMFCSLVFLSLSHTNVCDIPMAVLLLWIFYGFFSVLCLLCLCTRLFICALWSPAGKGLTSWLSFVVSYLSLLLSHWYPESGVVLDWIDS